MIVSNPLCIDCTGGVIVSNPLCIDCTGGGVIVSNPLLIFCADGGVTVWKPFTVGSSTLTDSKELTDGVTSSETSSSNTDGVDA